MSLDDTQSRMVAFRDALSGFQEVLGKAGQAELAAQGRLQSQWDDEFARAFLARYAELESPVGEVRLDIDRVYLPFIDAKIGELRRYLDA